MEVSSSRTQQLAVAVIEQRQKSVLEEIRARIQRAERVAIATVAWSALGMKAAFLAIKGYWIDKDWVKHEELLGFPVITHQRKSHWCLWADRQYGHQQPGLSRQADCRNNRQCLEQQRNSTSIFNPVRGNGCQTRKANGKPLSQAVSCKLKEAVNSRMLCRRQQHG